MAGKTYTVIVQRDQESGMYVGTVPALPGCHTQGETLEELRANLLEAIELMLEVMAERGEQPEPDAEVTLEQIERAH